MIYPMAYILVFDLRFLPWLSSGESKKVEAGKVGETPSFWVVHTLVKLYTGK